ncbi:hypothetical protein [Aeromonas hydrophila]|uniref:hypothetical protein n=1 Tax=Aeromonas TaxID=642 RepID=UPI00107EBF63|nr:hypothetical protein [Aeromonas hydrophila]QBX72894.1 hypothetical protein E4625_19970 [Aeromonas hydrophila]QBX77594.1 hypothetical protein E4630_19745 [Aeromonas hydrophila]
MVNNKILAFLLDHDAFDREDDGGKRAGVAQYAKDNGGYENLSGPQQALFRKWFSRECCGHRDGDEWVDCARLLEGDDLLEAYTQSQDPESVQCDDCAEQEAFVAGRIANGVAKGD